MNHNHSQNGSAKPTGDLLAMQLTAYALGELDGREQAEIERLLADPAQEDSRRIVAETRRVAQTLSEAASAGEFPARSPELRAAILQQLPSLPVEERVTVEVAPKPAKRRWSWVKLTVGLAATGLLAALLWPATQFSRQIARRETRVEVAMTDDIDSITPRIIIQEELAEKVMVVDDSSSTAPHALTFESPPVAVELDAFGDKAASQNNLAATIGPFSGTGIEGRGEGRNPHFYRQYGVSPYGAEGQSDPAKGYYDGLAATADREKREKAAEYSLQLSQTELSTLSAEQKAAAIEAARLNHQLAFMVDGKPELRDLDELKQLDQPLHWAESRRWRDPQGAEQYTPITENRFLSPKDHPLSTFSIDVDTASYANTRRFLTSGNLPPADAVRIEELVNYFTYSYPQPKGDAPFSVNMEVAESPWREGALLLRVGLKGKEIHRAERPASNMVFLIDVSGSMADENKLPLVKTALSLLVGELTENDRVSIVTYAGDAGLRLAPTSGDQKQKILAAIDSLASGGSTHGSAGIQLAYEQAAQYFIKGGTNRVILATDGDLNVGITDDAALVELIKGKAAGGTFLTVLGFGEGNLKDAKMEGLADNGNGIYAYIDGVREARKVLVEQMTGSTITIAKDVKIQIEFNPAQVAAYRQLGYENRVLAAQDFNNDKKDAGEIGAGHTVTALYEIIPVGAVLKGKGAGEENPGVDPLKYQAEGNRGQGTEARGVNADLAPQPPAPSPQPLLTDAAASGELLTLKLRYKEPEGETSKLLEVPLKDRGGKFAAASKDMQFAAAVASFGMVLRGSRFRGDGNLPAVAEIASSTLGDDPGGYRAEFVDLVRRAQALGAK